MKHHKPALITSLALLILLPPLPAKERRGAEVLIRKIDGAEIQGELIAVKIDALLVLSKEGRDVTVGVRDIHNVKIIRKSHPWRGAGIGFLVGVVPGAIYGSGYTGGTETSEYFAFWYGVSFAVPAAILGAITSGLIALDKTYLIQGRPPRFVKAALEDLRKRARVREVE